MAHRAGQATRPAGRKSTKVTAPISEGWLGRGLNPRELELTVSSLAPGITITVDVSVDLLNEGANTVAVALVPGKPTRRIERAVSFLWLPAARGNSRRSRMPAPPQWNLDELPTALAGRVGGPPLRGRDDSRSDVGRHHASHPAQRFWFTPPAERRAVAERTRQRVAPELPAAARAVRELHEAVKQRAVRPVISDPFDADRSKSQPAEPG